MEPSLLARVRWGNVAKALTLLAAVALVVAWPRLAPAEPELPPPAPVPVAPAGAGSELAAETVTERALRRTETGRRAARPARGGRSVKESAGREGRPAARRTVRRRTRSSPAVRSAPAPAPAPPAPAVRRGPVAPAPAPPPRREFGFE